MRKQEFAHSREKKDWHRADIIASLRKKGTTLAALSRASGYSPSTLQNALERKWPRGEKIIAEALGLEPSEIWPTRYDEEHGSRDVA